jgi:hypothetical protein
MPHNLVVVTPGSREKIGQMPPWSCRPSRIAEGKVFVPKDKAVLASTKLDRTRPAGRPC